MTTESIPHITNGSDPDSLLDWLTNSSYDNLTNKPDHPMSDEEEAILMGEGGESTKFPHTDILAGASVIWRGKRCFLHSVEFHYRNDGTREMWGTPVSHLETDLPSREVQTDAIKRAFAHALPVATKFGGTVVMNFCEFIQPDGTSTDDRHVLYIILPIKKVMKQFKSRESFHQGLLELLGD